MYDGGIGVQLESLHPDGGIGGDEHEGAVQPPEDGGGEPEEPGDMPDVVNGRMRFTITPKAKANNNLCIIIY